MKPTRISHMQPASPLKNILISLFHRELNAIDRSGPFKISTSISISSSNTHTVSSPQVMTVLGLGELAGAVCLRFEVFLVASSPPFSLLLNNVNQRILVSFREGMNECITHLLWPLLSAHPPPSVPPPLLSRSMPICIWNALDHLDWKSWLFSVFA